MTEQSVSLIVYTERNSESDDIQDMICVHISSVDFDGYRSYDVGSSWKFHGRYVAKRCRYDIELCRCRGLMYDLWIPSVSSIPNLTWFRVRVVSSPTLCTLTKRRFFLSYTSCRYNLLLPDPSRVDLFSSGLQLVLLIRILIFVNLKGDDLYCND